VLIALAIVPEPDLIIADEPTSALDATVQRRILDLLGSLQRDSGTGFILITHDLAIAAEHADNVVVLKDGRVQERGRALHVFRTPTSEYTKALLADVPGLLPQRYGKGGANPTPNADADPVAVFSGVAKTFTKKRTQVTALEELSFSIPSGTTHALVGESGSGKSTAARLLLGLETPDAGTVDVHGQRVEDLDRTGLRALRREVQLVYQNPFTSLNPRFTVARIVAEPLERFRIGGREERRRRVAEVLAAVGLDESYAGRRPDRLSGGQRQRVAIARALAAKPRLIVLDEPTSALDVTVQAEILQVLVDLQNGLGVSYLFVSHDLGVVRQFADTVTVLRAGHVVESGTVERVFTDPHDDYTVRLIDSIPGHNLERTAA
jgi:peptide/nickel transport system ATP-binding protein